MGRVLSILAVSLIFFAAGCSGGGGNSTTDLHGTVTYKGQMLGAANLTFVNDKGEKVTTVVDEGKFTVGYVPVGDEVKVLVDTQIILDALEGMERNNKDQVSPTDQFYKDKVAKDTPITEEMRSRLPLEMKAKQEQWDHYMKLRDKNNKGTLVQVPKKYGSLDSTPLKFKITSGKKELNIVIED